MIKASNMDSQNNKNEEVVDLSQFPTEGKEKTSLESFSLNSYKTLWRRMGRKNQIFTIIIAVSFILIIVLSCLMLSVQKGREAESVAPGTYPEYTPPVGYPLSPGEKYTPPLP